MAKSGGGGGSRGAGGDGGAAFRNSSLVRAFNNNVAAGGGSFRVTSPDGSRTFNARAGFRTDNPGQQVVIVNTGPGQSRGINLEELYSAGWTASG